MSKFTPGPWELDEVDRADIYRYVFNPKGHVVCRVELGLIENTALIGEENAKLIAAAPAMYEALQLIADGCIERRPGHVDFRKSMTKARIEEVAHAALKAATGEDK